MRFHAQSVYGYANLITCSPINKQFVGICIKRNNDVYSGHYMLPTTAKGIIFYQIYDWQCSVMYISFSKSDPVDLY